MKRIKVVLMLSVILLVALIATGCGKSEKLNDKPDSGSANGGKEQNYTFKIGMVSPPSHPYSLGSRKFADAVKAETNGKITIQVYDSGQLGGERDLIEQVQFGTLDMALVTLGPIANFVDDFAVFDLPFIFDNSEHAYKTLDGPVGQEIMAKLKDINIVGLSYWENGFRHLSNNVKPIQTTNDMKGLKMRAMENQIQMESFRKLGADPTPIAWPEVYTSLQQGVAKGLEVSVGVFETSKLYEVQNQFSILGLFYQGAALLINQDIFNSLPTDLQEKLTKLGKEYAQIERQMVRDMEKDQLANMEAKGVKILKEVDPKPFMEATKSVYDTFKDRFGKYYDRIEAEKP